MLETLEWLTKYGFIEIFFGLGVVGLLARLIRKVLPSNYDHLHVDVFGSGPVTIPRVTDTIPHSFSIALRNAGNTNLYVARAYFRPKLRRWWSLWLRRSPTRLKVHPKAYRIIDKDAIELKFSGGQNNFTEYETLVRPGASTQAVTTWLPLSEAANQEDINKRQCGVLYVEYATWGKQGVHVVRV